jgi:hypothetical protein
MYQQGHRIGRRDARYARMFGRTAFRRISVGDARVISHSRDSRAWREYWLGYARGVGGLPEWH